MSGQGRKRPTSRREVFIEPITIKTNNKKQKTESAKEQHSRGSSASAQNKLALVKNLISGAYVKEQRKYKTKNTTPGSLPYLNGPGGNGPGDDPDGPGGNDEPIATTCDFVVKHFNFTSAAEVFTMSLRNGRTNVCCAISDDAIRVCIVDFGYNATQCDLLLAGVKEICVKNGLKYSDRLSGEYFEKLEDDEKLAAVEDCFVKCLVTLLKIDAPENKNKTVTVDVVFTHGHRDHVSLFKALISHGSLRKRISSVYLCGNPANYLKNDLPTYLFDVYVQDHTKLVFPVLKGDHQLSKVKNHPSFCRTLSGLKLKLNEWDCRDPSPGIPESKGTVETRYCSTSKSYINSQSQPEKGIELSLGSGFFIQFTVYNSNFCVKEGYIKCSNNENDCAALIGLCYRKGPDDPVQGLVLFTGDQNLSFINNALLRVELVFWCIIIPHADAGLIPSDVCSKKSCRELLAELRPSCVCVSGDEIRHAPSVELINDLKDLLCLTTGTPHEIFYYEKKTFRRKLCDKAIFTTCRNPLILTFSQKKVQCK